MDREQMGNNQSQTDRRSNKGQLNRKWVTIRDRLIENHWQLGVESF